MQIIQGSPAYIDSCLSIGRELPEYFPDSGIAAMRRDLQEHRLYVVVESNQVIGFAAIHPKSRQVAEISWMAVTPAHRHQGVGTMLINQIAVDLKAEGTSLLEVKTLAADVEYAPYEGTRRFYEGRGFVHLETIDPYPSWEPGNPCAIYVKVL
jgi:GNAT superfamily N-acetyltransferase